MPPLDQQFEIRILVSRTKHTNWLAGGRQDVVFPHPRVRVPIDTGEIVRGQRLPARTGAVDERSRCRRLSLRVACDTGYGSHAEDQGEKSLWFHFDILRASTVSRLSLRARRISRRGSLAENAEDLTQKPSAPLCEIVGALRAMRL